MNEQCRLAHEAAARRLAWEKKGRRLERLVFTVVFLLTGIAGGTILFLF